MINTIVAVDKNWAIGKDNKLLAHIKCDLEYFKRTTNGHIVVMGYNTYMSLPIKPLPNRTNIVITRKDIELDGCIVVNSIDNLFKKLDDIKDNKEVFIIGGASIYEQFLPYSDRLFITHIFHEFEADTFFPKVDDSWEIENVNAGRENIDHKYPHVFTIYKRKIK